MRLLATILFLFAFGLVCARADGTEPDGAWTAETVAAPAAPRSALELGLSFGVMNGEAKEFVYVPAEGGRVLSRLDWTMDNVPVLNGEISWRLLPGLAAGLRGRINIDSAATMNDYDFNLAGCPPLGSGTLCHSFHRDTRLSDHRKIDAYVAGTVLDNGTLKLDLLAGSRSELYKWEAFGGEANYTILPPELGISYAQWWKAPYIGAAAEAEWDRLTLTARVTGSFWVDAKDRDNHHLRGLLFDEKFGRSQMIEASAGLGYRLDEHWTLTTRYDFQHWLIAKGPTKITDYVFGGEFILDGDAAGANNVTHGFSAGLSYRF